MRAFSIWLVLLQHGGINIHGLAPLKIGGIGVEIFFVISGFLIGGILFREIDKGKSGWKTLRTFWTRRWFRILPLYYAVLLFKYAFVDSSIGANIWYYVFFLQNNFYGINYLMVSWSLVIEEWFYLFAPIFLLIITSYLRSDKHVFIAMLVFIAFVSVARLVYVLQGDVPYESVNGNFPFRFDSMFLGIVLAYIKHKRWMLYERLASSNVFLTGVALLTGYLYYYWTLAYPDDLINGSLFPRTMGFLILPFSISLTVPFLSETAFSAGRNRLSRMWYNFITTTSILTYGIYLLHPFVYEYRFNLFASIFLTYLAAWIVYTFFEKPLLNFRDRITGQGGLPQTRIRNGGNGKLA